MTLIDPQFAAMEARLHRACLTIAALPGDGPKGFFSTWPRYKLDWWDAEDFGSQRTDSAITARLISPPRFAPTPAEVDDCLPALALVEGASRVARRVLMLRAHQLWYGEHAGHDESYAHWRGGWRAIAQWCGLSHWHARAIHRKTVQDALTRQAKQVRKNLRKSKQL